MIQYQAGPGLKIIFIGINPHPGSDARGVPFSNNKMFWYLLSDAGLIEEPREWLKDDKNLKKLFLRMFKKKYKFGILNVVDRPTRSTIELKRAEALPGRKKLNAAFKKYKPNVICFVGKITYSMFSGKQKVDFGWQENIGPSKIFVMHAPHHGLASVRIKDLKEVYAAASRKS